MTDNQARGGVSEAEVEAAQVAYDTARCRLNEKWHGGSCEPISDAAKRNVRPMMLAALEAAALARASQDHGGDVTEMVGETTFPAKTMRAALELKNDYRQRAEDAEADALRLHREKMVWFDRTLVLEGQLAAAEARAAKAVEVLRKVEWGFSSPKYRADECPSCGLSMLGAGHHAPDCPLATLLSDHPAPEPGVEAVEDRVERLENALRDIERWSQAYPLDVFPEADDGYLMKANEVLKQHGMGVDRISVTAMRHVVEGVGQIAIRALQTPANGGRDGT